MNQSFFNGLHFVIRALLTLWLYFFLINTAFDNRFFSFWLMLAVLVMLFLFSSTIEINFTPTTDFWIRFPVRLTVISLAWVLNLTLILAINRSEIMFILLIILSYHLFTLLLEWRKGKKSGSSTQTNGPSAS